jgi:phage recombination protein Bet
MSSNLVVTDATKWTEEQISIIKQQIAVGCSDAELALFGQICQRTGLDPFTRQIYAISRSSWNPATKQSETKMTVQLGIDGFRSIAAASGLYAGSQTFWCGLDGVWVDVWLKDTYPAAAKTIAYRGDSATPFVAVAKFGSYVQTNKDGKPNSIWSKMPELMIGKVSEALCLRKAFPQQLSGLYATEEMQQANSEASYIDPEMARLISEQRQAMVAKFNKLGWTKEQREKWALDTNGGNSSTWSLDVWIEMNDVLQAYVDGSFATRDSEAIDAEVV